MASALGHHPPAPGPPPTGTPAHHGGGGGGTTPIPATSHPTHSFSPAEAADAQEQAAIATEATRQDLELKLKELIECLLELSITVNDYQAESNGLVQQKIEELISQLSEIEGFKDKLDMMVPMEVLGVIEQGGNPDLFTRNIVECVAGENQFTNGKISAMKSFESALLKNLGSTFTDEMGDYQDILREINSGAGFTPYDAPATNNSSAFSNSSSSQSPP